MFEVRTDLALEEQERLQEQQESSRGISVREEASEDGEIRVTTVQIKTENAGKMMGKPRGTYITLESSLLPEESGDYHRDISRKLAELLWRLVPGKKRELSVLVAGLGI